MVLFTVKWGIIRKGYTFQNYFFSTTLICLSVNDFVVQVRLSTCMQDCAIDTTFKVYQKN